MPAARSFGKTASAHPLVGIARRRDHARDARRVTSAHLRTAGAAGGEHGLPAA